MSGSVIDKPDGNTPHAQVTKTCLPATKRPNKTPIFITGVSEASVFLDWLRASYPGGLTTQLKEENLMVVPLNADGFRAAASAQKYFDGKDSVSSTPSRNRKADVCDYW
jgi:hypothetical protein